MRYAIFTDIHANLEALEAVLTRIDELAQEEPIDQICFLGDLVGYGPNPNECIVKLRERTDVIIAGNHDWAAVGKIDLDEFSEAARISAQWTAEQLTEEHRAFLANLPEKIEIEECLLVHGSPYGPLWEYLTSEVLAERSFQYFTSRYCLVGHTHVPVIFQQPDDVANAPTAPLGESEITVNEAQSAEAQPAQDAEQATNGTVPDSEYEQDISASSEETSKVAAMRPTLHTTQEAQQETGAHSAPDALQEAVADTADIVAELQQHQADDSHGLEVAVPQDAEEITSAEESEQTAVASEHPEISALESASEAQQDPAEKTENSGEATSEDQIVNAEEHLNQEIEELLALLGLTQSMIRVTNEMVIPPEGEWSAPEGYRAIINPGGVGQPRDGDPRASFMIYNTEADTFTFYRIPYNMKKTQEKIIKAGLPIYLAKRLEFGR